MSLYCSVPATMMIAVVAMCGCATVPLAPMNMDATAKRFQPPADQANLYVYRNEQLGGAVKFNVNMDGSPLGDTAAMTYLYTTVAPGRHSIVSKAENDSEATIDVEAGRNYFVWQEVKMGVWTARTALQAVDEQRGRAGVLECKMGQTLSPVVASGCGKDSECKGDRICFRHQCISPSGIAEGGQNVPPGAGTPGTPVPVHTDIKPRRTSQVP